MSTLSLPPQRGRLFELPQTLCYVFRLRHRAQIDRGAIHKELYAIVVLTVARACSRVFLERTTKESRALAPSTLRSRWLLRLGMNWRICPFYKHPDGNIITIAPNVSVARKCFPAKCHWHGSQRDPRHFFPLPGEV